MTFLDHIRTHTSIEPDYGSNAGFTSVKPSANSDKVYLAGTIKKLGNAYSLLFKLEPDLTTPIFTKETYQLLTSTSDYSIKDFEMELDWQDNPILIQRYRENYPQNNLLVLTKLSTAGAVLWR